MRMIGPHPARPPHAVVDIGSNSVRLVVYDGLERAPFPRFNEKSLCRLGAGLAETGELSADGCRRTLAALRRFAAVAGAMNVPRIDVIATEAVRRASNGNSLVAAIAGETGLAVRVISGAEEAHYAALGVIAGFYQPAGVVGDMGGGSLEVAAIAEGSVGDDSASLPLGALPVQALLAQSSVEARRRIDTLLAESLPPGFGRATFYAIGGGWRSLARAHMLSVDAPVRVAHGYSLDAATARDFAKTLWRPGEGRSPALAGIPARRARTLQASALVLDRLLRRLAPERIVFSALGLREGWLYAQLEPWVQALDPLLESARAFGTASARVPAFLPALERWTSAIFEGESHAEKRLRLAACALSDVAWRDHPDVRAIESYRRLLQFPFIGLDHPERAFVAAAIHARYAGKADDPLLGAAIGLLPPDARRRALVLGRVLLLGYRISGSVPDILESARLSIEPGAVKLEVSVGARVPDSEVVLDRLNLLAAALGVRNTAIVEAALAPGAELRLP